MSVMIMKVSTTALPFTWHVLGILSTLLTYPTVQTSDGKKIYGVITGIPG